jgi:chloramphenicol 3-O-phosphotransferase
METGRGGKNILSGPIGAGKTAVSKELIGLLSGPLATIEGDQFWRFLVKRAEGDRREGFRVIMRAMTSAAGSFVRTGYDVLLDFSIPPAFLPIAQKILRDAPLSYIVLRPPLEICAARARDRAEGKIMKYDRGFYAMFAAEERQHGFRAEQEPQGDRRDHLPGAGGGPFPGRAKCERPAIVEPAAFRQNRRRWRTRPLIARREMI